VQVSDISLHIDLGGLNGLHKAPVRNVSL
jgi:hypothetical protein